MTKHEVYEISIETLEPQHVACFQAISATPEDDSIALMQSWLDKRHLSQGARRFGFDVEVPPAQAGEGIRGYEVWRSVPAGTPAADGVSMRDFSGGLYATLTLRLPFPPNGDPFIDIPAGWKFLHEWVSNSDRYQGGSHQWLEELVPGEGGDDLKLYHPIAPAGYATNP